MTTATLDAHGTSRPPRFSATRLDVQRDSDRAAIDEVAARVRELFAAELAARPSRHVYVSSLPPELIAPIARLRAMPEIERAIRAQFRGPVDVTPLTDTDELYVCHYNEDHGGDHGLFARHYDGNLRFVPFGAVVRALVYVRSSGDLEVVFADSGLRHRFVSYEIALLDFHRELHWVDGTYEKGAPDRILLKLNYLVVPHAERALAKPLLWINLGQFFVVKAAMEYSKSPRTPLQRVVGWVCNAVRLANNVHPVLPHMGIAVIASALIGGAVVLVRALIG